MKDQVVEQLAERAKKLVPGDPFDKNTRLGAVVSKKQQETVLGYIDKGKSEGASVVAGGNAAKVNGKGYFVEATIFDGVKPEMTISREEIFGPVLAVLAFDDVEEAVHLANQSMYGLAAGIWTRDISKAHRVAHAIRAGTVWINTYNIYDPAAPFGGYKQSGFRPRSGPDGAGWVSGDEDGVGGVVTDAFITTALRTPVGRAGGALAEVRADDLAAIAVKAVVERSGIPPARIEDVIFGCTNQAGEDNRNVARMAALLAGLPVEVPGQTVNRLCGSGLQAVISAAQAIRAGEGSVFIAGGVENMTRAPYVMLKSGAPWNRTPPPMADSTVGWRFTNPRMKKEWTISSAKPPRR